MAEISPAAKLAARRIRELRDEQKLTQERLAYLAGLNKGQLSKIERALIEPGIGTLEKIANALGVILAELTVDPVRSDDENRISQIARLRRR